MANQRAVGKRAERAIDKWYRFFDQEAREELLIAAEVHAAIAMVNADDDLRRHRILVMIRNDVVRSGGHRDVEKLAQVSVEDVDDLVPLLRVSVVQRQTHVQHPLFAEDLG